MTGSRAPRRKGDRTEQTLARLLQEQGFAAQWVPRFGGDLSVPLLAERIRRNHQRDGNLPAIGK